MYAGQAAAIVECRIANAGKLAVIAKGDAGQVTAISERIRANAGDAIWDGDAGQAIAIVERILTNAGKLAVFAKCDTGQAAAIIERSSTNAGDAIWDGDTGQVATIIKRTIANAGKLAVFSKDHAGQSKVFDDGHTGSIKAERIRANTGNAIWDSDAAKVCAIGERTSAYDFCF